VAKQSNEQEFYSLRLERAVQSLLLQCLTPQSRQHEVSCLRIEKEFQTRPLQQFLHRQTSNRERETYVLETLRLL